MSRDEVYLRHILDAIRSIESYIAEGRDLFFDLRQLRRAVEEILERS